MTAENTTEYFDLITSGLGYLNRSREVKPNQGSFYESVSIAALRGSSDNPRYSYFDCRVVGADAIEFVKMHRDAINDRDMKVLVKFNVGDGEGDSYELTKGDHKGERRHLIKARLLKITWAKVGDVELDMKKDETEVDQAASTPAEGDAGTTGSEAASDTQAADTTDSGGAESWVDTLGETVKLDKNDPNFMSKKSLLKERGYRWDRVNQQWMLKAA
jgi:hypothetical protein